jgi:hypothetical protein
MQHEKPFYHHLFSSMKCFLLAPQTLVQLEHQVLALEVLVVQQEAWFEKLAWAIVKGMVLQVN